MCDSFAYHVAACCCPPFSVLYLQRRTRFDSADYYMQREGKADVLLPSNPSPETGSALLELPALMATRPSRLSCSS